MLFQDQNNIGWGDRHHACVEELLPEWKIWHQRMRFPSDMLFGHNEGSLYLLAKTQDDSEEQSQGI